MARTNGAIWQRAPRFVRPPPPKCEQGTHESPTSHPVEHWNFCARARLRLKGRFRHPQPSGTGREGDPYGGPTVPRSTMETSENRSLVNRGSDCTTISKGESGVLHP